MSGRENEKEIKKKRHRQRERERQTHVVSEGVTRERERVR